MFRDNIDSDEDSDEGSIYDAEKEKLCPRLNRNLIHKEQVEGLIFDLIDSINKYIAEKYDKLKIEIISNSDH